MNYQDGFEFEHRCAAFLKTKGYRKVTVTPPSGDQGIDVIAYKSGVKYGIQCKYYVCSRSETRRYRKHTAGLASMTVTVLWS